MDLPLLADQQEHIYISSLRTRGVVWRTWREQWIIRIDGERKRGREREKSVLLVRLDDDDDDDEHIKML